MCLVYIINRIFTLYAKALSLDIASRVWDVFFRDGEGFLFRTAIGAILKSSVPCRRKSVWNSGGGTGCVLSLIHI